MRKLAMATGKPGRPHSTNITARAGIALLMEGSTMRQGKYSAHIRKAVDWLVERGQDNGLLGNTNVPAEAKDYMEGHGFAMLFLASVCGQEEKGDRRKKLEKVLTRAVEFEPVGKFGGDLGHRSAGLSQLDRLWGG